MKTKKILAIILSALMVLTVLPVAVFAGECAHSNMFHVLPESPTCTDPGNNEYWFCEDCYEHFADENATIPISYYDYYIPALGGEHSFTDDVIPLGLESEPDCGWWVYSKWGDWYWDSYPGYHLKYCENCDNVFLFDENDQPTTGSLIVFTRPGHRDLTEISFDETACGYHINDSYAVEGTKYYHCNTCNKFLKKVGDGDYEEFSPDSISYVDHDLIRYRTLPSCTEDYLTLSGDPDGIAEMQAHDGLYRFNRCSACGYNEVTAGISKYTWEELSELTGLTFTITPGLNHVNKDLVSTEASCAHMFVKEGVTATIYYCPDCGAYFKTDGDGIVELTGGEKAEYLSDPIPHVIEEGECIYCHGTEEELQWQPVAKSVGESSFGQYYISDFLSLLMDVLECPDEETAEAAMNGMSFYISSITGNIKMEQEYEGFWYESEFPIDPEDTDYDPMVEDILPYIAVNNFYLVSKTTEGLEEGDYYISQDFIDDMGDEIDEMDILFDPETGYILLKNLIEPEYSTIIPSDSEDLEDIEFYNSFYEIILQYSAPACEHELTATEYKAATCLENGNNAYWTCSKCGKVYKDANAETETTVEAETIVAAGSHSYNEAPDVVIPSTCITLGCKKYNCLNCDYVLVVDEVQLDSSNHEGGTEFKDGFAATCTVDGKADNEYCLGCGAKLNEGAVITAEGHKLDMTAAVASVASTCKTKGYDTYKCQFCEYTENVERALDPANHEGGTEFKDGFAATCTVDGKADNEYCLGCGAKLNEGAVITAEGHKLDMTAAVASVASTCKTKGYDTYKCQFCDYTENVERALDPANHEGETEIRGKKEASCSAEGYTGDTYCLGCNEKIASGEAVQKSAHTPETIPGKAASCTETGLTDGVKCSVCQAIITEQSVIAKTAHDYVKGATTPATCTEDGSTVYTCNKCGGTKTEKIAAAGHKDADGDKKCDNCGADLGAAQEECNHLCHKSGFLGFIWKIVNFFNKLFKKNQFCECGVAHW